MPDSILSPLSFTSVFDTDTGAVIHADIYFYTGGTTDAIAVRDQDGQVLEQPVRTTGNGRFPPIFVGIMEFYRIRIYDLDGVLLEDVDGLPGAVADVEPGDPLDVDDTALLTTGDIIARFAAEAALARTNFVRCNGKTIGDASSGATELAHDDAEDLFIWLYQNDTAERLTYQTQAGTVVDPSATWANAAAAWAAHARISVPDLRGRTIAGLDVMGNTASARLTAGLNWSAGTGVAPGDAGGSVSHQLTTAQLSVHAHANTASSSQGTHTHTATAADHFHSLALGSNWGATADSYGLVTNAQVTGSVGYPGRVVVNGLGSATSTGGSGVFGVTVSSASAGAITTTMMNASEGGGSAHNNMQPTMTLMFYMRL